MGKVINLNNRHEFNKEFDTWFDSDLSEFVSNFKKQPLNSVITLTKTIKDNPVKWEIDYLKISDTHIQKVKSRLA